MEKDKYIQFSDIRAPYKPLCQGISSEELERIGATPNIFPSYVCPHKPREVTHAAISVAIRVPRI